VARLCPAKKKAVAHRKKKGKNPRGLGRGQGRRFKLVKLTTSKGRKYYRETQALKSEKEVTRKMISGNKAGKIHAFSREDASGSKERGEPQTNSRGRENPGRHFDTKESGNVPKK